LRDRKKESPAEAGQVHPGRKIKMKRTNTNSKSRLFWGLSPGKPSSAVGPVPDIGIAVIGSVFEMSHQRISETALLWRERASITVRFVRVTPVTRESQSRPGLAAGAFSLLAIVGSAATEQKYPVLLEYAKACFERIKQRLRHLWALARVKRVFNDYTLANDLDV
jgi:hypothetical protein